MDTGPLCRACGHTSEYWEVDPPLIPEAYRPDPDGPAAGTTLDDLAAASEGVSLNRIVQDIFSESFLLENGGGVEDGPPGESTSDASTSSGDSTVSRHSLNPDEPGPGIAERPAGDPPPRDE